jgi:hypothetical protein
MNATDLSPAQRHKLYQRLRQFKVKAQIEETPFFWKDLDSFIESIFSITDDDPETFRITFDKPTLQQRGYHPDSLRIKPYNAFNKSPRKVRNPLTLSENALNLSLVSASIAILTMSEAADIDDLCNQAVRTAIN